MNNQEPRPCILCRYSEIALKGKNREFFELALMKSIKDCLKRNYIDAETKKIRGRIFIYTDNQEALSHLKRVFGLSSVSKAFEIPSETDTITKFSEEYTKNNLTPEIKTFRVSTNRADKRFKGSSSQMDIDLGSMIVEKFNLKVNLKKPDFNLNVEIHQKTYIYHEKTTCAGGLPVGVSGKIACIIKTSEDLILPLLLMKRGCKVFVFSKEDIDTSLLSLYDHGSSHSFIKIKDHKDTNTTIEEKECHALAVPDLLDEFDSEGYGDISCPILTPMVGYSSEQKKELLERFSNV